MKKTKKMICILLTVVMLLGLAPALASDFFAPNSVGDDGYEPIPEDWESPPTPMYATLNFHWIHWGDYDQRFTVMEIFDIGTPFADVFASIQTPFNYTDCGHWTFDGWYPVVTYPYVSFDTPTDFYAQWSLDCSCGPYYHPGYIELYFHWMHQWDDQPYVVGAYSFRIGTSFADIFAYIQPPVEVGRDWVLLGWNPEVNETDVLTPDSPRDFFAMWYTDGEISPDVLVEFWGNGGTPNHQYVNYSLYAAIPSEILFAEHLVTPIKGGHDFLGWFRAAPDSEFSVNGFIAYYARWEPIILFQRATFHFDGNGGELLGGDIAFLPAVQVFEGATFNRVFEQIEEPVRDGFKFAGWFTAPTDGVQLLPTYVIRDSEHRPFTTIYAQWREIDQDPLYINLYFHWIHQSDDLPYVVRAYSFQVGTPFTDIFAYIQLPVEVGRDWILARWEPEVSETDVLTIDSPRDFFAVWNAISKDPPQPTPPSDGGNVGGGQTPQPPPSGGGNAGGNNVGGGNVGGGQTTPPPQQSPPANDPVVSEVPVTERVTELPRVEIAPTLPSEEEVNNVADAVNDFTQDAASRWGAQIEQPGSSIVVELPEDAPPTVVTLTNLPEDVDVSAITTMAVLNPNGTLTPVPTRVVNGRVTVLLTEDAILVPLNVSASFSDLEHVNANVRAEIERAASLAIVEGFLGGTFRPGDDVTAQQAVAMFLRATGIPVEWETAMATGAEAGFISSAMAADAPMTRIQTAQLIASALEHFGLEFALSDEDVAEILARFPDIDTLTAEQRLALAIPVQLGIFQGHADATIRPDEILNRSQMASLAVRLQLALLGL